MTLREIARLSPKSDRLGRILELARRHLGMDVAYVAQVTDGRQVYRVVDGDTASFQITVGDGPLMETTYCQRMLDGTIPGIIPDSATDPRVSQLATTLNGRIGSYIGVPLTLADGTTYGTFCCLGHSPDAQLDERDLRFMSLLGDLVVEDITDQQARRAEAAAVQELVTDQNFAVAAQPIVDLRTGSCLGLEALARFPAPHGTPDQVFAIAHQHQLGIELERLAAAKALTTLLPALSDDQFLSVNLSPAACLELATRARGTELPLSKLVVEITEHAEVDSYRRLRRVLAPLRKQGLRVAIDDAGAGYASLHHVVELNPDFIKVDRTLVSGAHSDRARRMAITAFVLLAVDLDAQVIAEGIEDERDLNAMCVLGVPAAQGYLLARPSIDQQDHHSWCRQSSAAARFQAAG